MRYVFWAKCLSNWDEQILEVLFKSKLNVFVNFFIVATLKGSSLGSDYLLVVFFCYSP